MSINKSLRKILLSFLLLTSFFAFGCDDNNVAVNNIEINLQNQTQVVLLVDEFFDIGENVEVSPNYATDKGFTVYTMNENVVRVVGKQIRAVGVGETYVRVVSNSNDNIEDVVSVKVLDSQQQIEKPSGLRYIEEDQSFVFSPVDYAVSYSININEREFNIGNINKFLLSDYSGEKFDNVLSVKVKANAPSYSQAYVTSEYSDYVKIFQTSRVEDLKVENGKLVYTTKPDLIYDIYFDDEIFLEGTTLGEIDLLNLADSFAGFTKNLSIVAKPNETIKGVYGNILYSSSTSNKIVLNILDEPVVSMFGSVISWENAAFVDSYEICINNSFKIESCTNSFDLSTLEYFNNVESQDGEVELYVKSKLPTNSTNLAKTNKLNKITFEKLQQPIIATVENGVVWQPVNNATVYSVLAKKDGQIIFEGDTNSTSFDLGNSGFGSYEISVAAVGSNGVKNYITSQYAKVTVVKYAQVAAQISDYTLNIQTAVGGKYLIKFVIDDNNTYSETVVADKLVYSLDLSQYDFKKGVHNIEITQLGNNASHINGETKVVTFTQLEQATVTISNSVASVTRSSINTNANIYIETSGTTLTESITVNADSFVINTTDTSSSYLEAGDYSVVAYIFGDGSSTFSYRNGKEAIPCGKAEFKVLDVPSLTVLDSSKAEISINKVDLASNYTILDENNLVVSTVNDNYSFVLASGNLVKFKVRANGDGCSTLSSLNSSEISIKRLVTPEISFDASNVSISVVYNNDTKYYSGINLYYEDLKIVDYTFGETFASLKIGNNNFKVGLTSNGVVDGVYYIDSLESNIVVNKLNNELTATIDSNNKLNISNPQEVGLVLDFDFDNNEYLAENGVVAGLNYDISSKKYVISLLNSSYKAIIPEMADGFKVKAKFVSDKTTTSGGVKTYYTNSDWTNEVELALNNLKEVEKIYTDTNNKIVVENPNNEKLYLDMQINIDGQTLLFKDNGFDQLVGEEYVLPYSYNANKYYIDIFESDNIKITNISAGDVFAVKVMFRKIATPSDIDSNFSQVQNITYLAKTKFTRVNQTLEFISIAADYELDKYELVVNETNSYNLSQFESLFTTEEVGELTKYTVDMVDLWNSLKTKLSSLIFTDVVSFEIKTLNSATTQDNALLGSKGEIVYVQQAENFNISTKKVDGLTILEIEKKTSDYSKIYSVDILGYKDYLANDNVVINVTLDELEFAGELVVKGFTKVDSSYIKDGKTINVFSSVESNAISVTRLAVPTLAVANNQITYTTVSGATDYEVYKLSSGSIYEKVAETDLIRNGTSFMFKNLAEIAEFTVAVKAVTTNTVLLNSNLSECVTVAKLAKSSALIKNGNVKISLPTGCVALIETGNVQAVLDININGVVHKCTIGQDFATSVSGITWSAGEQLFNVNGNLIFKYTEDYIVDKNISITLQLNGCNLDKYYIYSDLSETNVRGLFAPINPKVDKIDASIEKLSWSNNPKNKLSESGELVSIDQYVFAINHNEKTYYSSDAKLKYLNEGVYNSYGAITLTNVAFPYGYDANNDGDFEDEDDVVFDNGEYRIAVAAIASGFASSPFSQEYRFSILNQTTLSIDQGKLVWERVPAADKYIVRIRTTSNSVVLEKEIDGLIYDFEDFDSSSLHVVTVQAVTTNIDMLNSKESLPLSVYRLKTPTNVEIDNGLLKVTASPFIYAINVEYNGQEITYTNPNQEENLKSVSNIFAFISAQDVQYYIDLTSSHRIFEHANGKIKVRLCGNTGTVDVPIVGTVGMVNSKTVEDQITSVVLETNVNTVSKGKWKFSQNDNLGSGTNKVSINYNFNNDSLMHNFWQNSIVYQIQIDTFGQGDNKTDNVYAVDYYRFMDAVNSGALTTATSQSTYYVLCDDMNGLYAKVVCVTSQGNLYFNVYYENTLNLQDYDELYYYPIDFTGSKYTSENSIKTIDLASGGSFVVKIRTVGGDDKEGVNYSYLTSYVYELQPFVRFGQSYLSTSAGQLVFADLGEEGYVSPIYKVTVYEWNGSNKWYVYLYNKDECTEEQVREKFNLDSTIGCEPITLKDENVTFEVSEYFGAGIYKVDVRAMAGIGADDYLLNAKEPVATYVIKILTSTNPQLKDGNITFDLAYVNSDGVYTYSYDYELVVDFEGNQYIETISSSTAGVVIEGTKLTYTIPNQINGLNITNGNNYKLKVRALTNEDGMINAKFYDANNDKIDEYLPFTRATGVTNVRIENGVLKWVGDSASSKYLIKLDYFDNGYKSIVITSGYIKDDINYHYVFEDSQYTVHGLAIKSYILPDVDYAVSVSKLGNDVDTISSSYTEITNVFRLNSVGANEIVTNNGILTWTSINDAVGYIVEIIGNKTYVYTINSATNSLDTAQVSDDEGKILEAGEYIVKIKTLGNNKINSMVETASNTITKLEKAKNVKLLGASVVWDGVNYATGYFVRFTYNGKTTEQIVDTNSIATPDDVVGKLNVEIIALGGSSKVLLNSDSVIVESSSDTPSAVVDLKYNADLNRFEWKTQADFINTDTISLTYDFVEYTKEHPTGDDAISKSLTISYQQAEYYDAVNQVYYLPITVMGYYKNLAIKVQRVNAIDSAVAIINEEVKWFKYGGGTETNPYVLHNMESLLNVKYYPEAHYQLIDDITITGYSNEAIIQTEFKGTIYGESYQITVGGVALTDATEFALFRLLNGATIKNLDIQANIVNTIGEIDEDIKLAVLAVDSQNAKLTNVRILASRILVQDNATIDDDVLANVYLGGMFAKDVGSTLSTCSVEIVLANDIDCEDHIYMGAVAAEATSTVVEINSSIKLTVDAAKNDIRYLGAVAGYYLGTENQEKGVFDSIIELNVNNDNALYLGGVFGYARTATIKNNTINGTIVRTGINSTVYLGGVVGTALSCKLYSNNIDASISVSLQNMTGTQRIGFVVGSLEVYFDAVCELKGNYTNENQTTLTTNTILDLGLYGYIVEGVVVDKNYTE